MTDYNQEFQNSDNALEKQDFDKIDFDKVDFDKIDFDKLLNINTNNSNSEVQKFFNIFDIRSEIRTVIKYSIMFIKKFYKMLRTGGDFLKNMVFNSFKYSYIVVLIFCILLFFVILFSKNKYLNLLVLAYFFVGFTLFTFIGVICTFVIVCVKQFVKLCIQIFRLFKKIPDLPNSDTIRKAVVTFFEIFWICVKIFIAGFLLCCSLIVLGIMSIFIRFILHLANVLFEMINAGFAATSYASQKSVEIFDNFGIALRKAMDRCGNL